ncbi:MAG TPA: O-antigen ligase family protein [Candidatus Solibacter sp.]|nr:O-antigen ligase family protein [Candidatus Solibacter sp.]
MKSSSPTASIPDPTPILFLVAIILALVWAIGDLSLPGLLVVAATLALAIAYSFADHPWAAVVTIIVVAALPRLAVSIGGLNARPEHIISAVLLVATPFWLKRSQTAVRWMAADYLLVAFIAINLFSSLFTSLQPSQTLKWALQQMLAILPYFFFRVLLTDSSAFRRAVRVMLAVGAVEAAYGIVAFFSSQLFKTTFGVTIDQYGDIPGTYGTHYEANILAAYCGACSVVMLTMYLTERSFKYLVGFGITLLGMAISLSRAALAGTSLALVLVFLRGVKLGQVNRQVVARIAVTLLCVALIAAPSLLSFYSERFSSLAASDITADDSARGRLVTTVVSLDDILIHPLVGNGTASFQLTFDYSQLDPSVENGWIGNTAWRVLHDTGVIGFVLFTFFLGSLLVRARRTLKQQLYPELSALLLAAIVYCVSFQTTEGTLLSFSWVHIGLIACALATWQQPSGEALTANET